ncbi:MAG: 16S rRNA (cytosine(1402)-N(4))-methyltransferase RsmH, partial [Candidatus Obscuribacterales bacterium]|nr:16S rRNA (cytosine(1402)-N(4))-methyltransferase RsmH [Candidatus Obscuribacterales bacterium]
MIQKKREDKEIPEDEAEIGDFVPEAGSLKDRHMPVLLNEAIDQLAVCPGKIYIDATAGAGGHLQLISERLAGTGTVIGIDQDKDCIKRLTARNIDRAVLVHSNFNRLKEILADLKIDTVTGGILADLGVSSMQVDDAERGFSFQKDGPLDMRMDPSAKVTAEHLINTLSEEGLSDIFFRYGEERHSRRIAHTIVRRRPLHTTLELADLISGTLSKFHKRNTKSDSLSGRFRSRQKHPATRTFQALRIAVNDELGSLEKFLNQSLEILGNGARLAIITFHSLEDRIVKQFLIHKALTCV